MNIVWAKNELEGFKKLGGQTDAVVYPASKTGPPCHIISCINSKVRKEMRGRLTNLSISDVEDTKIRVDASRDKISSVLGVPLRGNGNA